jgi:hypothetical protein
LWTIKNPKSTICAPGSSKEKATAGYNLLIGNASGLELKLNGEPVEISGKEGEIVNIQLPKN